MTLVTSHFADHVSTLTINRPEALNALTLEILDALSDAIDQAVSDDARCLVITGAGRAFVAGADVAAMSTMTRTDALAFSQRGSQVFRKIETLPIPSIAAVNGFALGGGCELAMCCDIRLASEKASFAQPEVSLGVPPGFGGTVRLPRLVGRSMANEMLLTGRRITANTALGIGLVSNVYPAAELAQEAAKLAAEIATQSPVAVRAAKTSIGLGSGADMDTALGIESMAFAGCFESDDQREGMRAFVDKREHAPFTGR
jgi:enoyl-CoA hydratase